MGGMILGILERPWCWATLHAAAVALDLLTGTADAQRVAASLNGCIKYLLGSRFAGEIV